MTLGVRKKKLLGVAAVTLLALSASGCSSLPSIPDWVDPTTWFGSDEPADAGQTPDLASIPGKPGAAAPDEQQKVADQLATDRTNAKYSADALRGGTEPAAAPPPDLPVPPKVAADEAPAPTKKTAAAAPVLAAPVAPVQDRSIARDPSGANIAGALPATEAGAPAGVLPPTPNTAPVVQSSALPDAAPAPQASAASKKKLAKAVLPPPETEGLPDGAQPALPPVASAPPPAPRKVAVAAPARAPVMAAPAPVSAPVMTASAVSPSDAELGFKPSSAPPLDPSVSQFVAAPIVNHYRQSAANAGYVQTASAAVPAKKARRAAAMGGPETMTGAVVANLDVLNGGRAVATPAAYSPSTAGGANAVVYFPGDIVSLNAEAKAQIRAAVEQYKSTGGQGYIRVIGHSSSRTPNMTPAKHVELVFKKSQDRASAVAQEIIREGVPAAHVLVEAVGDSQPVYYESMPKGEDGNRRAEIFLQG